MATIGPIDFDIKLEGGDDARLLGTWTIDFDAFDQSSNLAYREVVRLIGDDTAVGDVGAGLDDRLSNVLEQVATVRSNGQASRDRSLDKFLSDFKVLNEDLSPFAPRDELRLVVELDPIIQGKTSRESNIVTGQFA